MEEALPENIGSLLEQISKFDNVPDKCDFVYNHLTVFLRAYPRPDATIKIIEYLQNISRDANYDKGLSQAYHCYALYYGLKGDASNELGYFLKAIEILSKKGASLELGNLLVDVAIIYFIQQQLQKAISLFNKAILMAKMINSTSVLSRAYANYGLLLLEEGQFQDAEKNLKEAVEIARENSYEIVFTRANLNLINLYAETGNLAMTELMIRDLVGFIRKNGNDSNTWWGLYRSIGAMYRLKGDYKRAFKWLQKLLLLKIDNLQQPVAFVEIAILYIEMKQIRKAILMAKKGLQVSELQQNAKWALRCNKVLSISYASSGDYKNAFFYKLKCEELQKDASLPENFQLFYSKMDELKIFEVERAKVKNEMPKSQQLFKYAYEKEISSDVVKSLSYLTSKELEVLSVLSLGISDKQIADKMFVSIATVKTHLRSIFSKLSVSNRGEAIRLIYELKLFDKSATKDM